MTGGEAVQTANVVQNIPVPASPAVANVSETIAVEPSDNKFIQFFDVHPRWAVFFFVLCIQFIAGGISALIQPFYKVTGSIASLVGGGSFLFIAYLAIINYRNKRRDILMAMLMMWIIPLIISFVGYGICLGMLYLIVKGGH